MNAFLTVMAWTIIGATAGTLVYVMWTKVVVPSGKEIIPLCIIVIVLAHLIQKK